jgi:L-threonylcarbamoyladenylate synthase
MSTRSSSPSEGTAPEVLRVDHDEPDRAHVSRVADTLKRGGIVATRTDTVYGLLASVSRTDALRRLAKLKVRPSRKPFVLLAGDWITVRSVTSYLTPAARVLGSRHWPGPLTLVLPAYDGLPDEVTSIGRKVAVRIPRDRLLLGILDDLRSAIAAPSANLPGEAPAVSAAEVVEIFGRGVDLVLDDGLAPAPTPSTIVDCSTRAPEILRRGLIDLDLLSLSSP